MDSVIYDKLKEVAAAGDTITYGEVGRLVGLAVGNPGHLSDLSWRLGEISEEEVAEGRPMLSAVVVTRETSRPGQGFLPEGRRLKPDEAAQSDDFWRDEVRRVWSYWKGVTDGSGKSNLLPRAVRTALNETFPAIIRANYVSDDEWRQQRDDPRDCYAKAFKKHLDNEINGWFLPPGYVSIQEGEHSHTWIVHNRPASDGSHETASRRGSIDQVHVELQLSPDLHRPESIASHPHGAAGQVAQTDFVADSGKVESRHHFACVLVPCRPPCKDDLEETVLETIERTVTVHGVATLQNKVFRDESHKKRLFAGMLRRRKRRSWRVRAVLTP